jgi:hypothetical protein
MLCRMSDNSSRSLYLQSAMTSALLLAVLVTESIADFTAVWRSTLPDWLPLESLSVCALERDT